ncbi:MAG: carboxypeptidase regulatory-like domain-containing protein [Alphaproteobacteria bacterium]|nr:carboxypeptidase regulatory-like domain-containing protein [Alphaproteobacteria bacterium]
MTPGIRVALLALPTTGLVWLTACSAASGDGVWDDGDLDNDDSDLVDTAADVLGGFYLAVEPASEVVSGQTILPRRFGPYLGEGAFPVTIEPAVTVRGSILGEAITPWAVQAVSDGSGGLPTEAGPVAATLTFREGATQAEVVTRSDDAGRFEVPLHPGLLSLTIVPDDPSYPVDVRPISAYEPVVDLTLDIGRGVPIWGRVRDGSGVPIPNAGVTASTLTGVQTSVATTDDAGWYELRVQPGGWRVSTTGPQGGREPTLTTLPMEVGDDGLRVDLAYRAPQRADLTLRVVDSGDRGLEGMSVRLTSRTLDGYALGTAAYGITTTTDSRGYVDARVPDGTYDVTVEPRSEERFGARRLADTALRGETDLGNVMVVGFVDLVARIVDGVDTPLVGAQLLCTETEGLGRTWLARTDDLGVVELSVPRSEMRCTATPPGDRLDLSPLSGVFPDPLAIEELTLEPGTPISGTVTYALAVGASPGRFATVLVLDDDFEVVASGLTDDQGRFDIQAPAAPER